MNFPANTLQDRLVTRYQAGVDAGLLAWCGLVGSEADAQNMPKMPGAAILLRAGVFAPPRTLGSDEDAPQQQLSVIEWTVYAGGQDQKARGKGAGQRGERGANVALDMVIQIAEGFEMKEHDEDVGFPLWIDRFEIAAFDLPAGKFIYEVALRHEWSFE